MYLEHALEVNVLRGYIIILLFDYYLIFEVVFLKNMFILFIKTIYNFWKKKKKKRKDVTSGNII